MHLSVALLALTACQIQPARDPFEPRRPASETAPTVRTLKTGDSIVLNRELPLKMSWLHQGAHFGSSTNKALWAKDAQVTADQLKQNLSADNSTCHFVLAAERDVTLPAGSEFTVKSVRPGWISDEVLLDSAQGAAVISCLRRTDLDMAGKLLGLNITVK